MKSSPINEYFNWVVCINLERRPDRWAHVEEQCDKHNLKVDRFEAYDIKAEGGGNWGCNCSHRSIMELIAHNMYHRVLILEDDFEFVYDDTQERFAEYIKEVPEDWEWLYLGGGYANDPKYRHSEHVMRINGMMTTSSYAVTWRTARKVAPWIYGSAGIDTIYHGFTESSNAFCLTPRLAVQYTNMSDIQCREMDNSQSMLDSAHEGRFPWLIPHDSPA